MASPCGVGHEGDDDGDEDSVAQRFEEFVVGGEAGQVVQAHPTSRWIEGVLVREAVTGRDADGYEHQSQIDQQTRRREDGEAARAVS